MTIRFLACFCLIVGSFFCACKTHQQTNELLRDLPLAESKLRSNAVVNIYTFSNSANCGLVVSRDAREYAISEWSSRTQLVFRAHIEGGDASVLLSRRGKGSEYPGPMDLLWSPSGRDILVQIGYQDSGVGEFHLLDSAVTNGIQASVELNQLLELKINQRPNRFNRLIHGGISCPIWTHDGKLFQSQREAVAAGYCFFQTIDDRLPVQSELFSLPITLNGRSFNCITQSDPKWHMLVVEKDKIISRHPIDIPPYGGLLWISKDGSLFVRNLGALRNGIRKDDIHALGRWVNLGPGSVAGWRYVNGNCLFVCVRSNETSRWLKIKPSEL